MSGRSAPRREGVPLTFLIRGGVHSARRGGATELSIRVRLTSYRSLPLSCIREIQVAIDGSDVQTGRITFVLDGHAYRLGELGERTDLWWYILDHAELRVAVDAPLPAGTHTVDGSLTTLVPFATGGRTTSTRTDRVQFEIEGP